LRTADRRVRAMPSWLIAGCAPCPLGSEWWDGQPSEVQCWVSGPSGRDHHGLVGKAVLTESYQRVTAGGCGCRVRRRVRRRVLAPSLCPDYPLSYPRCIGWLHCAHAAVVSELLAGCFLLAAGQMRVSPQRRRTECLLGFRLPGKRAIHCAIAHAHASFMDSDRAPI